MERNAARKLRRSSRLRILFGSSMSELTLKILLLLGVVASLGAQPIYLVNEPGRWKPWQFTAIGPARAERGATPAEVKAFEAKLLELREFVRKVPGIAQPVGFSVLVFGHLDSYTAPSPDQPRGKQLPLAGAMSFGAFAIFEYSRNGQMVREDGGETALLQLNVNALDANLIGDGRPSEWQDVETDAFVMPRSHGEYAGFPRLGQNIIVKKRAQSITTPLSLEGALKLLITARETARTTMRDANKRQQAEFAQWQTPAARASRKQGYEQASQSLKDGGKFAAQMQAQEPELEAIFRENLSPNGASGKGLRAAEDAYSEAQGYLVSLTTAQRAAPACYDSHGRGLRERFGTNASTNCAALVRPNWAYFDPKLPRSAPQLIVIASFDRCLDDSKGIPGNPSGCVANRKVVEGLDWAAVLNWLDR